MYEIKKDTPFFNTLRGLWACGLYTTTFETNYKFRFFERSLIWRCYLLVTMILSFLHFIMLRKENIGLNFSENLVTIIGGAGNLTASTVFSHTCRDWSHLMFDVSRFTVFGKPFKFQKKVRFFNQISLFFLNYCLIGTIIYSFQAYMETRKCSEHRKQHGVNIICRSVMNVWIPYKMNEFEEWVLFLTQSVLAGLFAISGAMMSFLVWEIENMISLHFLLLKSTFPKIIMEKDIIKRQQLINIWLSYHRHILRLAHRLNSLSTKASAQYSLTAALIFGCIINQMVNMSKPVGATVIFFGYVFCLLLVCDAGQKMHDESKSVTDAVYNSAWYDTDMKTKKAILFIMMSSDIDIHLSALPLGQLNLALFLMIMKGSFSYLTLLKNTTEV